MKRKTVAPRPRLGAPTKFSPELSDAILAAVEKGMSVSRAAQLHGVGKSTVTGWKHDFPNFANDLIRAEARCVQNCLDTINAAAAAGDWKPHAWILARVFWKEFGEKSRVELNLRRELDRGFDKAFDAIKRDLGPAVYAKVLESIGKLRGQPEEEGGEDPEGGAPTVQ